MAARRSIVIDTSTETVEVAVAETKPSPIAQTADVTHMSLMGFLRFYNLVDTIPKVKLSPYGRQLAKMSRDQGLEIRAVADDRYGKINTYDITLMKKFFKVK